MKTHDSKHRTRPTRPPKALGAKGSLRTLRQVTVTTDVFLLKPYTAHTLALTGGVPGETFLLFIFLWVCGDKPVVSFAFKCHEEATKNHTTAPTHSARTTPTYLHLARPAKYVEKSETS